jgi:undecaprenyl-diphosphatase
MSLLQLDTTITLALYQVDRFSKLWQNIFYLAASGVVYILPLTLLWLFFRSHRDRINSVKIFLIAIFSWQVLSGLLGEFLYGKYGFRDRPFADNGIQEFFFERPTKAFPSDHSAVIFSIILAFFYYKYPKLGWIFLVLGVLSSLARVVMGFHWAGDIISGWAIGLLGFVVVVWLDRPITKIIEKFLSLFSKKNG